MVLMKVSGAAPDCALIWMLALMDSSTSMQQTFGNPSHRGIHLAVELVLRTFAYLLQFISRATQFRRATALGNKEDFFCLHPPYR